MAQLIDCAADVVRRYGGRLDKFTGDGIMALFGAPVALEDHALRACRAGLDIQREIAGLAGEVSQRDGIDLQLRIGLNSGQVIVGGIGTAGTGYTALGEEVGMAQRMESVAPPGGVMLSVATARLVDDAAVLAQPEQMRIKGANHPVPAQRLLGITAHRTTSGASGSSLVGREWEVAALVGMLDQLMGGRGPVVAVVGSAGIGKTRLVAEAVRSAKSRGVEVFSAFCESHTTDVPFGVVARLLRGFWGISGLDDAAARARVRAQMPDADPQDLLMLDDLLGIAEPDAPLPKIDPDARRRRLTVLINTAQRARTQPTLVVIEDAHWIDEASGAMIAEFFAEGTRNNSMVLFTYRPEYRGALRLVAGTQVIALEPLSDSETLRLVGELTGSDPSVVKIARVVGAHAAGNPFFAEEIIRELAERGVLVGERSCYVCSTDIGEVRVAGHAAGHTGSPYRPTHPHRQKTLCAAAVIGFRFSCDLLDRLGVGTGVEELTTAELVDQAEGLGAQAEYAFRHPLIRAVAYESQLTSDRAEMHRRLATTIQAREPDAAEQNAALIAEHLEAAGDLHTAYGWHMRAAAWAIDRDIAAARLSWERATRIADSLPTGDPARMAMHIAPRTMLCRTAYRVQSNVDHFEKLRELCTAAGDKVSLFVAMAGLLMDHVHHGRIREGSQLASEAMALIESISDATLTVEPSGPGSDGPGDRDEGSYALRWSQLVTDLTDGDSSPGDVILGSPLALALAQRANARLWLGRPGWRDDVDRSLAMARNADPISYAVVVSYIYLPAIAAGSSCSPKIGRYVRSSMRCARQNGSATTSH